MTVDGTGTATHGRTYTYVVDEATAGRLAAAALRARARTARFWLTCAGFPVGLLMIAAGTGTGSLAAGALAFALALPWLIRRGAVRQVRRVVPVGTRIETAFTDDALTVRMLTGSTTQQFRGLRDLRRHGSGVTFHVGGSRLTQVLPRECFPDEEIARALAAGATG